VVAIKVLPPSKSKDPHLLARFQRESALAVRLKHPNVVRAFQTGVANGLHYLVMEYLEGETLEEIIQRRGQLPPDEAVRLMHQVLLGLQHIHELGMVHRDLKPSNLMLVPAPSLGRMDGTVGCTVKVLDIGLGKALFDEVAPDTLGQPNITGEGVLLGTPDYLAPEQARNAQKVDIRADIYSLGCVLYHMLSGRTPFPDTNIINQMVRHASEAPRPLSELNPAVPDGLQQIVNWMMAKDPAQRYPTPGRAAQALEVFLVAGSGPTAMPENDPAMIPYLSWLEQQGNGVAGVAVESVDSPSPTEPVAIIAQSAVAVAAALKQEPAPAGVASPELAIETSSPASPAGRKHRHKKHKHRSSGDRPQPSAKKAPVGSPAEAVDVELVAVPAPQRGGAAARGGFRLDRRDFLMLALGAGGVFGAALAGFAVQKMVSWLRAK
jgi:serine/threonine protein kinase